MEKSSPRAASARGGSEKGSMWGGEHVPNYSALALSPASFLSQRSPLPLFFSSASSALCSTLKRCKPRIRYSSLPYPVKGTVCHAVVLVLVIYFECSKFRRKVKQCTQRHDMKLLPSSHEHQLLRAQPASSFPVSSPTAVVRIQFWQPAGTVSRRHQQ